MLSNKAGSVKHTLSPCLSQNASGVYTGFIKVQMDLRRPVTVRGGQRGAGGAVVEEAFYLPRGVNNTLHISSNNTVRQVANTHIIHSSYTHTHTHVNATSLGSDDIRDEVRVQQNRRWCWSFNKKCDRVQSVLCVFLTCWLISIHWESQYVTATGMTVSDWPAGVC